VFNTFVVFGLQLHHIADKQSTFGDHKVKGFAAMTKENSETENPESTSGSAEPTIQLDHFLQSCGVPTGGQAKRLIQSGEILVNDEVETRRKMKLRIGDVVLFDGDEFEVALDESTGVDPPE
jgi:ribosome-associated protein